MDIISLVKIVIQIALALIPLALIVAIVGAYTGSLVQALSYIGTGNSLLLIIALGMEQMLNSVYVASIFGVTITVISIVAYFRIKGA